MMELGTVDQSCPVKSKLSTLGESQTDDEAFIPDLPFQAQHKIVFHEAQFFPLQTQSNIYGLLDIRVRGLNKLVVATLGGEIFCLEYHKPSIQRPPSLTPITFNYIPGMAKGGILFSDSQFFIPIQNSTYICSLE